MATGVHRWAARDAIHLPAVVLTAMLLIACSGQQNPQATLEPEVGESVGEAPAAQEPDETRSQALNRQLDALLAENLSESDYQESFNCIYRNNFRHVSALGDSYLIFSKGDAYWVNRLRNRCLLLNQRMLFTFVSHTQSVCAGDSVYLSDRADLDRGFDASGRPAVMLGSCVLGEFEAISEAQALALREAVKASRTQGGNRTEGGGT